MTDEVQNGVWPMPHFTFTLTLGTGDTATFQEVSGLEYETRVIDYRMPPEPQNPQVEEPAPPVTLPGQARPGNVTLRKGVFADASAFLSWANATTLDTTQPAP